MAKVIIKQPKLSINGKFARISADLVFEEEVKQLWFECPAEYADGLVTETCDGFFVAMIIPMMRRKIDIVVDGALSSKLYYNVYSYYIELIKNMIPDTAIIDIKAPYLINNRWGSGNGVFTGFSGGVDSYCTVLDHTNDRVPEEYRLTHFLYNNVGSHGQKETDFGIFHKRYERLKSTAVKMGIPFITVNSNVDEITEMNFQLTHTPRNIAVALLFQKMCSKFYYSSAVHYKDSYISSTYDIGYGDAIVVPLLSTETTDCISSGGQYTRFDKTRIISTSVMTHELLDVCVNPKNAEYINCSKCWKCMRTLLTLDVLRRIDFYKNVFDIKAYNSLKWIYVCAVLTSDNPLLKEIVAGMKDHNFKAPTWARVVSSVLPEKFFHFMLRVVNWAGSTNLLNIAWRVIKHAVFKAFHGRVKSKFFHKGINT